MPRLRRLSRLPARVRGRLSDERGLALVLYALTMIPIMGMAALTLDFGVEFARKAQMQNAVDAAVLAASRSLPTTDNAVIAMARDTAISYAASNGATLTAADITFSSTSTTNDTIEITYSATHSTFFGNALGVGTLTPQVMARAQVGAATAGNGVMPFGMDQQNFTFGTSYCLKLDSQSPCGGPNQGNFHALDIDNLGNSSANVYEDKIRQGASSPVQVGDVRPVNTGNMAGPTRQGVGCDGHNGRIPESDNDQFGDVVQMAADGTATVLDWSSPRLVLVPIVEFDGNSSATVLGFAAFFLEGCSGNGSDAAVSGRFINTVIPGSSWGPITNSNYYGAKTVRLTQ